MKLIEIIKKNVIRMSRNKTTTLLILFGPIILVILLSLSIESMELQKVNIGHINLNNESMMNYLIDNIKSKNVFLEEVPTVEQCIADMKIQKFHLCAEFPDPPKKKVNVYVDFSKLSIVFKLVRFLEKKTEETTDIISFEIVNDLLNELADTSSSITNQSNSLTSVLSQTNSLLTSLNNSQNILNSFKLGKSDFGADIDLDELDIDPEDIRRYEREIRNIISLLETNLVRGEEEIALTHSRINGFKQSRDEIVNNLNAEMAGEHCQLKSFKNAITIQGTEVIVDSNYEGYDPTCTMLFTLSQNILLLSQDLDEISSNLDDLQERIQTVKENVDEFNDVSETTFDNINFKVNSLHDAIEQAEKVQDKSEKKIKEIQTLRTEILNDLAKGQKSITLVFKDLELFQKSAENIAEKIKKVSNANALDIINPMSIEETGINSELSTIEFFFPSLIVMLSLFISLIMSSVLVIKEKASNAYFRNHILPVNSFTTIWSFILTTALTSTIILTSLFLFSNLVLKLNLHYNYWIILLILLICNAIFSLIGLLIGYLMNNEESAIITSVVTSLILFMFSGLIFPLEIMKQSFAKVFSINPYIVLEVMLKKSTLYELSFNQIFSGSLMLVIEFVILFVLVSIVYEWSKKRI